MPSLIATSLLLAMAAESSPARVEPEPTMCLLLLICHEYPSAKVQLSPWLAAGGGWRGGRGVASFGAGLDGTMTVATFFQPPGGDNGGRIQLRLGPWLAFETPLDRWRGEGGLSLALRQERFEAWGTLGLRLGAGLDDLTRRYWVGVLSWGLYGERPRQTCGGTCPGSNPPSPPKPSAPTFGITEGVRLYAALRREAVLGNEWTFGVELQPTWFLPPYDREKWFRH